MYENDRQSLANDRVANVLFNAYHLRLLELLLLRPRQGLHVREIARRTQIPTGSLLRELRLLAGAGLLRRNRVGNQVHYQADPSCPVLAELTVLVRKLADAPARSLRVAETPAAYAVDARARVRDLLALKRLRVTPRAIAAVCRRHHVRQLSFFGSVTRPDFKKTSDVDVLIELVPEHPVTLADVIALRDELSKLFRGRRVDVATDAVLENPFRRAAILKELQSAYATS